MPASAGAYSMARPAGARPSTLNDSAIARDGAKGGAAGSGRLLGIGTNTARSGGLGGASASTAGAPAARAHGAASVGGSGARGIIVDRASTADELHRIIKPATPLVKAALCGMLMYKTAPSMYSAIKPDSDNGSGNNGSREKVKGERSTNGVINRIMVTYSYAFVGDAKKRFSEGKLPSARNNPFVAVGAMVYPKAQSGAKTWEREFIDGVTTARAGVHSDARKAMVTLCLHLVRIAAKSHPDLRHLPDLFRAAKAAMRDMELKDRFVKAMDSILHKIISAHSASARRDLRPMHVFGGDKLVSDFTQQVIIPLALDALCDAEYYPVPPVGEYETVLCLAERKLNAFGQMRNGGFSEPKYKMFQKALWYGLYNYATGVRRFGHPLATLHKSQFHHRGNMLYVAPWADDGRPDLMPRDSIEEDSSSEDEDNGVIVRETPFQRGEDLIIDETELPTFLDNMDK
ncbi:unnamed protein product [Ectocarpus sp. CCAP 1310/34]|nr:unnamed protein product [Ectocarpus sp. CCAP 1310/34]